ncbi:HNH endonuclease signature motif containing protein [Salmonella enterica subsp. enterica]
MAKQYRIDPPPDELRDLIHHIDGKIYYLPAAKQPYSRAKGKELGFIRKDGYRNLMITCNGERRQYLAHRIVYWLDTGEWPPILNHKNRNRLDNHPENLEPCTNAENCQNNTIRIDNSSGYTGVVKNGNRWRVQFSIDGETFYYDGYLHKETAALARDLVISLIYKDFARYGITANAGLKVGGKAI